MGSTQPLQVVQTSTGGRSQGGQLGNWTIHAVLLREAGRAGCWWSQAAGSAPGRVRASWQGSAALERAQLRECRSMTWDTARTPAAPSSSSALGLAGESAPKTWHQVPLFTSPASSGEAQQQPEGRSLPQEMSAQPSQCSSAPLAKGTRASRNTPRVFWEGPAERERCHGVLNTESTLKK